MRAKTMLFSAAFLVGDVLGGLGAAKAPHVGGGPEDGPTWVWIESMQAFQCDDGSICRYVNGVLMCS